MAIENTVASVTQIIRGLVKDMEKSDGRVAFEYHGDSTFTLPDNFIRSSSIIVYVNGESIDEEDFSFDVDRNEVTIDLQGSGELLSEGDIIVITYAYYKKWSDVEIQGYLKSALSYFVQYRYKKLFEINDDDEIVSENDLNPTSNELYFIAMIASILIDPQNITVNTPEFSMGRNREDSDQTQIAKAFNTFRHFVGKITFNPIEDDC